MGAVFCCLNRECEDFPNPNSPYYRYCVCLQCFTQNFVHVYTSLFRREEENAISSTTQGTTSFNSITSSDNSLAEMYSSPPRPLPYDTDIRSRRDKGSSHSNEEMEPLRRNKGSEDSSTGTKWNNESEYDSKVVSKNSTAKITSEFPFMYTSSEDEDVCPTCLDDYTDENPRIITKCAHHFHLGCIYEWMERSESCPVCGKVMVFDENI